MIEIRCASCDQPFTLGDESAGLTEKCPNCGALNDIPDESVALDETEAGEIDTSLPGDVPQKGGIPSIIWWALVVGAVTLFTLGIYWLSSDDWEQKHLADIVEKSDTAQQLISTGDFAGATRTYDAILGEVGSRQLQSAYLQDLLQTIKTRRPAIDRGARIAVKLHDAEAKMSAKQYQPAIDAFTEVLSIRPDDTNKKDLAGPLLDRGRRELRAARDALAAQSNGITSILDPTTLPSAQSNDATTQPDETAILAAITAFQRSSEGFPALVASKPIVFIDAKGKYRRRQYVVWDVSSKSTEAEDHAAVSMQLDYAEASRMTSPHDDRASASKDVNFLLDESDHTIYHRTQFRLRNSKWIATQRLRGDGENYVSAKPREFLKPPVSGDQPVYDQQDLWALEDQAFSGLR